MGRRSLLLIVVSGLFSVLLAIAVNVATGGGLPAPVARYAWLAWPMVGLLAALGIGLAWWQHRLADSAGPAHPAPAPSDVDIRPAELPVAPPLFGRADELAAIATAVAGGARVVVLAAAPGTGKSALALRAAHDARPDHPDGQLHAALRGASADPATPEAVLAAFLGSLGRPDDERRGTVTELAARFRSAVADRRVLVLLDDALNPSQILPLLPGGERCLTIVTSRRMLADVPGAVTLPVGGLRPEAALALLAATAGESRIAADPDGARRIVDACAGLPLAVRLAGARLRARAHWTPTALADRLADEERRLGELHLGDRAVRSTFRTAYEELSTVDKLVFRRVGSHPAPSIALGPAAARCGLDEPTTAAALDRLVDAFLVETPAPDRYRQHDLLRLFATETFEAEEAPAQRTACLLRQVAWLTENAATLLASPAPPTGTDGGPGIGIGIGGAVGADPGGEREGLAALARAAVAAGEPAAAWSLVHTLHPLLNRIDDHPYQLGLWLAGVEAARALGDDARRVRALRWASRAYGIAGQVQPELALAEEALALTHTLGDPRQSAESMRRVGDALRAQQCFHEAEATLTRALELFVALGSVPDEIDVRTALGTLYNTFWRYDEGQAMLERAAELLPEQESHIHGWVLAGLALDHRHSGRRDEAAELTTRAMAIARRLGDDFLLGYCHQERAWAAETAGRDDEAEREFGTMLALFQRIRHGSGVGSAYDGLGTIADKRGRYAEALARFDAGIAQFHRLGDHIREGEVRLNRARTLRTLGRHAEAARERAAADALIGDTPVHRRPPALPVDLRTLDL